MKRVKKLLFVACVVSYCFCQNAKAENLFGEFKRVPQEIEKGFGVGFDFGFFILTGERRSASNPGFQLSFTTGYDFLRYLTLEGIYTLGINQASALDPVLSGGVNFFMFDGALKGALPLGRFYPFVEVGGGITHTRPDFSPGENNTMNLLIAGGVEYYTYLRHYSLYLKSTYYYVKLPIDALTISAGIKYTF